MTSEEKKLYDMWAKNGGTAGDECCQFGIIDGCAENCPVLTRGECPNGNGTVMPEVEE
ncbi:MAG: hypothetical protein PHX74_10175 [Candidatus Sumerlaeales bacterium]|nr:hypothetical protein [Candidatus Sumerlaeales bacterium]